MTVRRFSKTRCCTVALGVALVEKAEAGEMPREPEREIYTSRRGEESHGRREVRVPSLQSCTCTAC